MRNNEKKEWVRGPGTCHDPGPWWTLWPLIVSISISGDDSNHYIPTVKQWSRMTFTVYCSSSSILFSIFFSIFFSIMDCQQDSVWSWDRDWTLNWILECHLALCREVSWVRVANLFYPLILQTIPFLRLTFQFLSAPNKERCGFDLTIVVILINNFNTPQAE